MAWWRGKDAYRVSDAALDARRGHAAGSSRIRWLDLLDPAEWGKRLFCGELRRQLDRFDQVHTAPSGITGPQYVQAVTRIIQLADDEDPRLGLIEFG